MEYSKPRTCWIMLGFIGMQMAAFVIDIYVYPNIEGLAAVTNGLNASLYTPQLNKTMNAHNDTSLNPTGGQRKVHSDVGYRDHTMTISLKGRMGNNMFEVAVLLGMSTRTGYRPVLPATFKSLNKIFNLSIPIISESVYNETKFVCYNEIWGKEVVNETIDNITKMANGRNVELSGFFQSFRYFNNVHDLIHKEFVFRPVIQKQVSDLFKDHINTTKHRRPVTKVGIHVRLGDMKGFGSRIGLILPPESFFKNAMKYFMSKYTNVYFIVCTDEPDWVRENLHLHNVSNHVILLPRHSAHVDLALLSSCDHMIITRGTYSWWAGYLNPGRTLYYKNYVQPNSKAAAYFSHWSFIPRGDAKNRWVPING